MVLWEDKAYGGEVEASVDSQTRTRIIRITQILAMVKWGDLTELKLQEVPQQSIKRVQDALSGSNLDPAVREGPRSLLAALFAELDSLGKPLLPPKPLLHCKGEAHIAMVLRHYDAFLL